MSAKTPKKIALGGCGPKEPEPYMPYPTENRIIPKNPIDNWDKATNNMQRCELCMHYAGMRCRRHAPKGQEGWPAVYPTDWCGDHKMSKATMIERS